MLEEQDRREVEELIALLTLEEVTFEDVSARRTEHSAVPAADAVREESSSIGNLAVSVQSRHAEHEVGVRLNGELTADQGEARIVVAARYSLEGEMAPSARSIAVFANEVAVMTLVPYLRETLWSITGKVFGKPVLLPIIERGSIVMELPPRA